MVSHLPDRHDQFSWQDRQNIEELILLRKLRKAKQGIDIEKLNRGEEKRKSKKKEPEFDMSQYGLHHQKKKNDVPE